MRSTGDNNARGVGRTRGGDRVHDHVGAGEAEARSDGHRGGAGEVGAGAGGEKTGAGGVEGDVHGGGAARGVGAGDGDEVVTDVEGAGVEYTLEEGDVAREHVQRAVVGRGHVHRGVRAVDVEHTRGGVPEVGTRAVDVTEVGSRTDSEGAVVLEDRTVGQEDRRGRGQRGGAVVHEGHSPTQRR